jgi:DNA-directed RNA polymerase specialized sigma24 family protein
LSGDDTAINRAIDLTELDDSDAAAAVELADVQMALHDALTRLADALDARDRAHRAVQLLARERDAARAELATLKGGQSKTTI